MFSLFILFKDEQRRGKVGEASQLGQLILLDRRADCEHTWKLLGADPPLTRSVI